MELYILDNLYRRIRVVDAFESLIWTERWKEIGDFELTVKSTQYNRGLFLPETKLAMNNSLRVMSVETVEDTTSPDGEEQLLVKGESLEFILKHRVAWHDLASEGPWYITTSPIGVPRTLFEAICTENPTFGWPLLDDDDVLPFVTPRYPSPEVPIDEDVMDYVQDDPEILYDVIKKHCDAYDLGFRLIREDDSSNLYFEVYTGRDRTTQQTAEPPVIFSVGLDSVQDTTEFTSIKDFKNVAYSTSNGYGYAVIRLSSDTPGGFRRRVMLVRTNVPNDYPSPHILIGQGAKEELLKRRATSIFEGEVNEYSNFKYGEHYELGDLVEMRNKDGVVTYKHVTEQIFVQDAEGERSYPALSIGKFENPDTWLSWETKDEVWSGMGSETWADM